MSESIGPFTYRLPEEHLVIAIQNGDTKRVEDLLQDANAEHPLFMGGKLLSVACSVNPCDLQIIQLLLNKGCSTTHPDLSLHRNFPMHLIAKKGHLDILQAFLRAGASVGQTNRFGMTPLHMACFYGHADVVTELLSNGSDINQPDCEANSPLFLAVSAGHVQTVDILIEGGCRLDMLNGDQLSPLDEALMNNKSAIISSLLRGGCSLSKAEGHIYNSQHYCNSILFSLMQAKDIDNIKLLMECGYTPDFKALYHLTQVTRASDETTADVVLESFLQPSPLMCLCRVKMRSVLNEKRKRGHFDGTNTQSLSSLIQYLPLPVFLKEYVAMKYT